MLQPPDVSLTPLLPVLIILAGAVSSTLLGFWVSRRVLTFINLGAVTLSALSLGLLWNGAASAFGGSLQADNAALLLAFVILAGTLMTLLVTLDTAWRARVSFPEFDAMLMYAVTGSWRNSNRMKILYRSSCFPSLSTATDTIPSSPSYCKAISGSTESAAIPSK